MYGIVSDVKTSMHGLVQDVRLVVVYATVHDVEHCCHI